MPRFARWTRLYVDVPLVVLACVGPDLAVLAVVARTSRRSFARSLPARDSGVALRGILLAAVAATACSAARPRPPLPLPVAVPGGVVIAARAFAPAGEVRVVEVAITSEHPESLTLDRRQVFARIGDPTDGVPRRVAPLTPAEAARFAGDEGLPGAARASAAGAAEGGLRGAATGAVTGGGAGGAIGAAVGAIGGIFKGAQPEPPDVAGFEDRALPTTTLRPGLSVVGLVYFPAGDYASLEVLLVGEREVVRILVPIAAPAPEEP